MYDYIIDVDQCQHVYEDNNDRLRYYWGNMNATSNIGACMYLYRKYDFPETVQDFYSSYTSDHLPYSKEHGRNKEYLHQLAEDLAVKDCYQLRIEDYQNYIYKKIFIDTFNGSEKEKKAKEIAESKGYTVVTPTIEDDSKYAIDFFIYKDDKLKAMIQVKANTFFKSNNTDLVRYRLIAIEKEKKAKDVYKVPMIHLIYDKNLGEFIKNEKGKYSFQLKDLINNDGTTKH